MDNANGFYGNICFAVAGNHLMGHTNLLTMWACRNNGAGDSLGKYTCSGGITTPYPHARVCDVFIRMVNWLKENDIPITVWDGEKAVPLEEWLTK